MARPLNIGSSRMNEKRTHHRSRCGEQDGLGADRGRLDHSFLQLLAGRQLLLDEIHQQDGIAHNDAGQGDHPDHGGGGDLRAGQWKSIDTYVSICSSKIKSKWQRAVFDCNAIDDFLRLLTHL